MTVVDVDSGLMLTFSIGDLILLIVSTSRELIVRNYLDDDDVDSR